ncbi:hypothetical protein SAMN05518672_10946 [Chitinophaga sp. CF118]|uniref:hypothetical protein n=1 Tax=Chitinophaga sp. CF118 TaxID=1884367 RepID=UPI0008EDCBAF|nr:hypothetical protein [Chitinophaga sp. CF118]SFE67845.1 hypothetical protein SAMN05518672_10946 [Chitinophaga sp. CF118]
MNKEFVNQIKSQAASLKEVYEDVPHNLILDDMFQSNINRDISEISKYDIAFYLLFDGNEDLESVIEKQMSLYKSQVLTSDDFENGYELASQIRELRLPNEDESEWEVLYDFFNAVMEGHEVETPILHLYFDGWKLKNKEVYLPYER